MFLPRARLAALALWWGSLTTLGFLVVPLLFVHLPTPALAGGMAAKLFAAQTWVSIACGLFVIVSLRGSPIAPVNAHSSAMIFIVGGVLLALLVEFAVAPRIVARENLKLWHTAGSGMYLAQWLCAGWAFYKFLPSRSESD
jgi:Domain of unknown function (DUF4149)